MRDNQNVVKQEFRSAYDEQEESLLLFQDRSVEDELQSIFEEGDVSFADSDQHFFEFDYAGQCIAMMYHLKIVSYARFEFDDDEVVYKTVVHDFRPGRKVSHSYHDKLMLQGGPHQIELLFDMEQGGHCMYVTFDDNPNALYKSWKIHR